MAFKRLARTPVMSRPTPRAVVTGGHGFIGSHIVSRLLDEGLEVLVLDLRAEPPAWLSGRERGWRIQALDITTEEAQRAVIDYRPDLVVHAAGQVRVGQSLVDPIGGAGANVIGTLRMLEAARAAGASGLVFFSSAAVYGEPLELPTPESHPTRPLSPYGVSKLAAMSYVEYYRRAGLLPAATLIPANVYGPGQEAGTEGSVVAAFMEAAVAGSPLHLEGDGRQTRDFIYVGDVVEAVWLTWRHLATAGGVWPEGAADARREAAGGAWPEDAADARREAAVTDDHGRAPDPGSPGLPAPVSPAPVSPAPGREATFNVGTGVETSVADLGDLIERVSGRGLGRVTHPARAGDISRSSLLPRLAHTALGWLPRVNLPEGLALTLAWLGRRSR